MIGAGTYATVTAYRCRLIFQRVGQSIASVSPYSTYDVSKPVPTLAAGSTLNETKVQARALNPTKLDALRISSGLNINPDVKRALLRVCRALLRECTYLPDANARTYMKSYILSRYKKYQDKPGSTNRTQPSTSCGRLNSAKHDARRALKWLRLANSGAKTQLSKVLSMTYGRSGKRRYELLATLNKDAMVDLDQDPVVRIIRDRHLPEALIPQTPRMTDAQKALFKAGRDNKAFSGISNYPKPVPLIPETNIWHRSLPVKRFKNRAHTWRKKVLSSLSAPLPRSEWLGLHASVMGLDDYGKQPTRRRMGTSIEDESDASGNGGMVSPDQSTLAQLRMTLARGTTREPTTRLRDGSTGIRAASMRRRLATVLRAAPHMERNPQTQKWDIVWTNPEAEKKAHGRRFNNTLAAQLAGDAPVAP